MQDRAYSAGHSMPGEGLVMVVDDDALIQAYAKRLLAGKGYKLVAASSGEEALERLGEQSELPDVILLDVQMDGMSGLEALRQIKSDPRLALIPVLIVTGNTGHKIEALELGASDFVGKPFRVAEMRARIQTHVRMSQAVKELEHAESLLVTLANTVEARDAYTDFHTRNVALLAEQVGCAMGLNGPTGRRAMRLGGQLHDLGKIAIPDTILSKPTPLTEQDWVVMRSHSRVGYNLLKPLQTLQDILPAVLYHHERWDGSGYPEGLVGSGIPLPARIIGIVDCYDAMTTDRPYRRAMSKESAVRLMSEDMRDQWDPDVLQAFLSVVELRAGCLPKR